MELAKTQREKRKLTVVRYADDFVIMHEDREMIDRAQTVVAEWLRRIGLELKARKDKDSPQAKWRKPGIRLPRIQHKAI